jgi:hypothetical protein
MTPRTLFSSLLARLEGAFDRAATDRARTDERARGEFISSLIIDHGAARGDMERGSRPGVPRS